MRKGIDVSSYQGDIDWARTKEYIDFAIIRCGYGNNITSQDDSKYKQNALECSKLDIPFGVYLFSYATDLQMAQSEVDHTLRLVKDYKLKYPIFLDVEAREQLNLDKEKLVEIVKYYCQKIEEAGYYVGIYASLNTLNNQLNSEQLDAYDKWVAQWSKDFSYTKSSGMWQNTDNQIIPGINTRVDGDIAFYDYPKIIYDKGLNHLDEQTNITYKYKVGDTLYLNGDLYENSSADEIIKEFTNKRVIVRDIIQNANAPYLLNIDGYAKEDELNAQKNDTSTCQNILDSIKQLIDKT